MVALGVRSDSAVALSASTDDDSGAWAAEKMAPEPAIRVSQDDSPVVQDPLLSTTTATSSVMASLSSAEEGDSDDADDEASDDDPMFIPPPLRLVVKEETTSVEQEQEVIEDERNSTDADSDRDDATMAIPSPQHDRTGSSTSRFSLISIPRRVRASVFSRTLSNPKVVKRIEAEHPSFSDEKTAVSIDRESTLDTPSPGSAYTSVILPSLTSFASLSRSLSQRSDDKLSTGEFKSFWDEKLRSTMDKIAHRSRTDGGAAAYERQRSKTDLFHLLLKLYAHQDVIEELYASYESNVLEFEFYIPQLCTFLIHGNYAKQHQLECFLMSRSGDSLMFAHRLFWFLRSFCGNARDYQSEYLSVTSSPEQENSDLLTAIQHRGGVPAVLMEQGLNIEEVSQAGNLMMRRASSFSIDVAAEETNTRVVSEDDEAFAAFLKAKRMSLLYEAMPEEGNEQQIALYNETPNFVSALTDLADKLIQVPFGKRNEELRRGLAEIGENCLPSNVIYLPIGNSCHRVKSVQLDECFTFSTKERVPYFLCIEVLDYSVNTKEDGDAKKKAKPLMNRRRSRSRRKFALNLSFKKTKDPEPLRERQQPTDAKGFGFERLVVPTPKDLSSIQELLDGLYDESSRVPEDLYMEEETKTNDDPETVPINYDLFDKDVLAATPEVPLNDAEVAARMEINTADTSGDGDDEKEETDDSEQKKRLGQWGLTRSRQQRPKKSSTRSGSQKPSSKFDSFYSSWFAKKQKKPLSTLPEASPVDEGSTTGDAIMTPQNSTVDIINPVEGNQERRGSIGNEPAPEPKSDSKMEEPYDSSDDGQPKRRGRDLSLSLDFTDADAWKRNFELEDALTDVEPEVTGAEAETPERTPEMGATKLSDDDEDGDEYDDEKPVIVFRERWSDKEDRIRKESPLGKHPGWRLLSVIVKSNDDLRQEQFAAQLIAQCDRIFKDYSLPLRLRPYNVIATSANAGLIEAVPNTVSLDSLKRNDPDYTTLLDFFQRLFGKDTKEFREARRNFVESLAAYSILCYVFQIKDRHNGNILLDTEGYVIHIDFGFLLTNSPGSNLNFERAPFKLTDEFVELMGGARSVTFRYFRSLCIRAYLALRRNMDQIVLLVEMMLVGNQDLPCFASGKRAVVEGLKERLQPGARTSECQLFVNQLIDRSMNNWRTRWYDKYQRAWVGIL